MEGQAKFGKVLRTNLLLVVVSAIIAGLLCQFSADYSLFVFAIIYLAQVLVNIIGFTKLGKSPAGYFLSALLVLIIGFSSCTGLLVAWETNGGPPR
jgi:multicomponent K+:H+ antiporter subunit F